MSRVCEYCDEQIIAEEWDERHSSHDGDDIHAECCQRRGPCSEGTCES